MKPSILSAEAEIAKARVRVFAEKFARKLRGKVLRVYECEPFFAEVRDRGGERWQIGQWGAELSVPKWLAMPDQTDKQIAEILTEMGRPCDAISIDDVRIEPLTNQQIIADCYITARVE